LGVEERTKELIKAVARFVEELVEALTFVLFALIFYSLWRHEFVFFLGPAESFAFYMALAIFCVICSIWHLAKCLANIYYTVKGRRARKAAEAELVGEEMF